MTHTVKLILEEAARSLARLVPAASWLSRYQRGWLTGDAVAGCTIWGLLIPK